MDLGTMAQNAYNQSQQLQNTYNQNAANATNQYNQSVTGANNAQSQLQDFTKNMQSGTDMYNQALQSANQNAGYDVNNLNQAQNQVSQLTGILGGLPRAVQASNANYGATAGDVAGQYATEGANLNQSLGLANQNTANQLQKMQGGLTGAQASTTAGLQGQEQQRQGYAAAASNATNIMQQAQGTMSALIQAQQSQGRLTADQQQIFAAAKANYAAAQASLAQAQQAVAQAGLIGQQTTAAQLANQETQQGMASPYYQNVLKYGPSGTPQVSSAPTPNASTGPTTQDMWNAFTQPMRQSLGSAGNFFGSLLGRL